MNLCTLLYRRQGLWWQKQLNNLFPCGHSLTLRTSIIPIYSLSIRMSSPGCNSTDVNYIYFIYVGTQHKVGPEHLLTDLWYLTSTFNLAYFWQHIKPFLISLDFSLFSAYFNLSVCQPICYGNLELAYAETPGATVSVDMWHVTLRLSKNCQPP